MKKYIKITGGPSAEELFLALRLGIKEKRKTPFVLYFENEDKNWESMEKKVRVTGISDGGMWNKAEVWEIRIDIPEILVLGKNARPDRWYGVTAYYSTRKRTGDINIDDPRIIE